MLIKKTSQHNCLFQIKPNYSYIFRLEVWRHLQDVSTNYVCLSGRILNYIILISSYRIFTNWRQTKVTSEWLFVWMCGFYSDIRLFELLPCPALASEGCQLILLLYPVTLFCVRYSTNLYQFMIS